MAWIVAPGSTMHRQTQAYSRLGHRLYVYENLDGSGFSAELAVDEGGILLRHDKVAEGVIADKAEPPAAMPEPGRRDRQIGLSPGPVRGSSPLCQAPISVPPHWITPGMAFTVGLPDCGLIDVEAQPGAGEPLNVPVDEVQRRGVGQVIQHLGIEVRSACAARRSASRTRASRSPKRGQHRDRQSL
jgi:Putative glycolipid-binding